MENTINFSTLLPTKKVNKSLIATKNDAIKTKISSNMTSLSQAYKALLCAKSEIADYIKEKGEKNPKSLENFNVELCAKILNEKDLAAFRGTFDIIDQNRKTWSGNMVKIAFFRAIGLTKPRTQDQIDTYTIKQAEKAKKLAEKTA